MVSWPRGALVAVVAVVLAACGGGGGDSATASSSLPLGAAPSGPIARVVVAGDSLADVGTFGFKATVQDASDPAGYPVYPEVVARDLGLPVACNHFSSADRGQTFTTNANCWNFAVAGALVQNPVVRGGDEVPFSLEYQLETAVAAAGGRWGAGDLLVVDAGGNDAASLADAYLDARANGGSDRAVFLALLAQQLDAGDLADALARSDGESVAAGRYMEALARTYWVTVKEQTLDRGAGRLAVLNVPDLTLMPRFRDRAAGLATTEGPAAAAQFQSDLRGWIAAFNAELARLAAGDPRVAVVPYFEDLTAQVANPAAFGLTNVTQASCPAGDFPDCTDAALDAAPPAGASAGWWRTWAFSDGFHPSPRGHELLGATVLRALAAAGLR